MASRMNLWGPRSRSNGDDEDTTNQNSPLFRPLFPSSRRHSRQDTDDAASDQDSSGKDKPSTLDESITTHTVPVEDSERSDSPIDPLEVDRRRKPYRRVAEHKARRRAMSISVSEEEERILRMHAASMDRSFSEWARSVMFRSIGRKVPSRGRGAE